MKVRIVRTLAAGCRLARSSLQEEANRMRSNRNGNALHGVPRLRGKTREASALQ